MPNINLIETQDVNGNISSCKTEITYLNGSGRPSLFYVENTGYATNNCTGQVDTFHSWTLSGFSIVMIIVIIIALFSTAIYFTTRDY